MEKQEERGGDVLSGRNSQPPGYERGDGGDDTIREAGTASEGQRTSTDLRKEQEKVEITPAVIERVGTQEDVRKASWEVKDLLRRMCKFQKV